MKVVKPKTKSNSKEDKQKRLRLLQTRLEQHKKTFVHFQSLEKVN